MLNIIQFLLDHPVQSILLAGDILATIVVGWGILWEAPEQPDERHRVAKWLVIGGIFAETVCSISLFAYDESVSQEQQSKIITLETRLAPRILTPSDINELVKAFSRFPKESIFLAVNPDDPEAVALTKQFISVFTEAGWHPEIWRNSTTSEANTAVGILVEEIIAGPPIAQADVEVAKKAIDVIIKELAKLNLQPNGPRPIEVGNPTALIRLTVGHKNP